MVFLNTEGYQREKVCVKRKGIMKLRFDITGKAIHGSKCFDGISAVREAAYKIIELEKFKDKEGVTCNVGTIEGGTVTNVVPETCSFTVDFRFASDEQFREIEKTVERLAATSFVEGSVCKVTRLSVRPALDPNEANLEMFRRFNEVCTANGLPEMITRQNTGGSDAADMAAAGITTLDSLGVVGENTHSIREKAELCSLRESAKRLACAAYCL
ncbi:MAG: peptidase dimerization domain-containing protein [Oscillospiraceae bacterium]|nr:peptidase dimerization domain-containing protein [Oscillospiraceae bacterium]